MSEVYYMQTGNYGTEEGVVVREKQKNADGTVKVINELGNGAGWIEDLDAKALVPMTKEEYDEFIEWNMDPTDENFKKIYAKIAEKIQK